MTLDPIDYWRLCGELSIVQAALLIVGVDPSSEDGSRCEDVKLSDRPAGYEAVKTAISFALLRGQIVGVHTPIYKPDSNFDAFGEVENSIDLNASFVETDSLIKWLDSRGVNKGFFSSSDRSPDYANEASPFYAPGLAAAVAAWEAVSGDSSLLKIKKPKQAMIAWLKKNGDKYGLMDDEGNPKKGPVENIATLANWDKSPGAAKTPDSQGERRKSTPHSRTA